MIQRICPVCDQVMKSAHYCSNCKRRVKHPYVMDVNFYLNERHPEREAGCAYHNVESQKDTDTGKETPQAVWKQVEMPLPPATPLPSERPPYQHREPGTRQSEKERSGSRAIRAIILVAALISFLPAFSGLMLRTIRLVMEPEIEYDIDLGDYTGEENDSSYQELEESDVISRGEACNSRGHFAVDGENMKQPILGILGEVGYQVKSQDTYSYNEVFQDGETWYTTWITIVVEGYGESGYQYVELDSDTGTGKLHEISLSLDNSNRLTEVTCAILRALAQEGELPENAECITLVAEELPAALASGSDYSLLEGAIQIEGISYESSYSVYISHKIDSDL